MTVAFDAFSNVAAGTGELSWTHTPVGTPRGIIVHVVEDVSNSDGVTGVTYGGETMDEVTGSPNVLVANAKSSHCFFLGTGIPTGAQTVVVSVDDTNPKRAGAISLTADADVEIIDTDATINGSAEENPSGTLSLGGRTCFASIAFVSGQSVPTNITPLTNWTDRLEHDFGSNTAGWYTLDTIGSSDVTAGWTQTSAHAVAISLAVSEVEGAAEDRLIGMVYSTETSRIG